MASLDRPVQHLDHRGGGHEPPSAVPAEALVQDLPVAMSGVLDSVRR